MAKTIERPTDFASDDNIGPSGKSYPLEFLPVTYSFGDQPKTPLQIKITRNLKNCLNGEEFRGTEYALPTRRAALDEIPLVYIVYGDGHLGSKTNSLEIRPKLPKSTAPLFLMINTATHLPVQVDLPVALNRTRARTEGVEGTSHCGVIWKNPEEVLWYSTQGNCQVIKGDSQQVMHEVAQRIQAHYASPLEIRRYSGEGLTLPWKTLAEHSSSEKLATRAHTLGATYVDEGGRFLIEDHVNFREYTSNRLKAYKISHAMNNADDGVGESMASESGPDGIMIVTQTGGRKVHIDANPKNFTPVWAIAEDGYVVPDVDGKPIFFDFRNGSRETKENALARLANSWARTGKYIENSATPVWQQFLKWVQEGFARNPFIAIQQPDFLPSSIESIDHAHWHATRALYSNIRITEPDYNHFPRWDFGCGTRHSGWSLISALMGVPEFLKPEGLGNTIIFVNLPGHGYVAVGQNREALTDAILNGVELATPKLV